MCGVKLIFLKMQLQTDKDKELEKLEKLLRNFTFEF